MKTTVIGSNKNNGKLNSLQLNNETDKKGEQPKTNGLPISKEFDNKEKEEPKKAEAPNTPAQLQQQAEASKADIAKPETQKVEAEQPKAEPTKKEVKVEVQQKPFFNLESTLKLVEELHRKKIQRERLLDTIDTLEAFEVAQIDDADETEANHFQGCVLTIEDDERRKFTTKNPVIIQAVAQFVNRMCIDRLAEIEAGITIPA